MALLREARERGLPGFLETLAQQFALLLTDEELAALADEVSLPSLPRALPRSPRVAGRGSHRRNARAAARRGRRPLALKAFRRRATGSSPAGRCLAHLGTLLLVRRGTSGYIASMGNRLSTVVGLFVLLAFTACGGTSGGSGRRLHYGEDAQENYEQALLAYRHGNCIDAEPVFRRIRREFPYSRFAALSELRIADCKFKDNHFPEAITAYRRFVRFRPSHSQVPYARFRIAESHFKQIPEDWLLAPPSFERDQGPTREALRQLRRFILDFPEDDRLPEARRMTEQCLHLLARHELYVARFYMDRDAWEGAAGRLRTLLATYAGSGLESKALLLLGQVYLELSDRAQARQAFGELLERYPDAEEAEEARTELSRLGATRHTAPAG